MENRLVVMKILRWVDGDTFYGIVRVRLSDVFAPELPTVEGKAAKTEMEIKYGKNKIAVQTYGGDAWNRLLARIVGNVPPDTKV